MNWERIKLKDACDVFADGDWIESKDQSIEGIRLIQTGNVGNGVFKERGEKARFINGQTFERLKCTEIFEGDCLVSRLPDPVGRACIIPETGFTMITAVDCTIIRFKQDKLVAPFFNYYSQSKEYLNAVDRETSGTTRKRISRSKLGQILVPAPSISEQHHIVAVLDEASAAIDKAKEATEKNLRNARELFEGYVSEIFEEGTSAWPLQRLGALCKRVSVGHVGPTSQFYCDAEIGVPFLRSQNVRRGFIDLSGLQYVSHYFNDQLKKSQLQKDDLLFVRVGANRGDCCIVPDGMGKLNCANIVFARLRENNSPDFIQLFADSAIGRQQLLGMSVGSAQGVINTSSVAELLIPYPQKEVRKKIVDKITNTAENVQLLERIYKHKISTLNELKKSILQKAFAGELIDIESIAV